MLTASLMLSVNGPLVMPANAKSIANTQCEWSLSDVSLC